MNQSLRFESARVCHYARWLVALLLIVAAADSRLLGKRCLHASTDGLSPISPQQPINLFNGKDLQGWYSYLRATKRNDPGKVFSVQDGAIRISGNGFGYLSSKNTFRDYHLIVEYRWGHRNWQSRVGKARDSGIFLHSRGPDGNSFDGEGAYRAAVECQVMEGAVGDLLLIKGKDMDGHVIEPRLTARVDAARDRESWPFFDSLGTPVTLQGFGRLNRLGKQRAWSDRFGVPDPSHIERPVDQWNRVECICNGQQIDIRLNGVLVNRALDVAPDSGHILLQCEGSEVFFRRVDIQPIKAQP